jgi:P-type E1-E2 ATPase
MIEINIPGGEGLQLEHLVCDVNGTLAVDGELMDGVIRHLSRLQDRLKLHLVTADTYGKQSVIDQRLSVQAVRLQPGAGSHQKADFVRSLGAERVVAIGQGANDAEMLQAAGLGIGILSTEGLAVESLVAADLIVPDLYAALELLERPLRIVASLRK